MSGWWRSELCAWRWLWLQSQPSRAEVCSRLEPFERGIGTHSAVSAAVIRNRRNAAIASTRCSLVRCETDRGAEERSSSPASPSAR